MPSLELKLMALILVYLILKETLKSLVREWFSLLGILVWVATYLFVSL